MVLYVRRRPQSLSGLSLVTAATAVRCLIEGRAQWVMRRTLDNPRIEWDRA
jgi:hypothetical protein